MNQVVKKPLRHFVHITNKKRAGFVEFNFSINDPSLFLEMILPVKAFDEFCQKNNVTFLSADEVKTVERQQNSDAIQMSEVSPCPESQT